MPLEKASSSNLGKSVFFGRLVGSTDRQSCMIFQILIEYTEVKLDCLVIQV